MAGRYLQSYAINKILKVGLLSMSRDLHGTLIDTQKNIYMVILVDCISSVTKARRFWLVLIITNDLFHYPEGTFLLDLRVFLLLTIYFYLLFYFWSYFRSNMFFYVYHDIFVFQRSTNEGSAIDDWM